MSFGDIIGWVIGLLSSLLDFLNSLIFNLVSVLNVIFGALWNAIGSIVKGVIGVFSSARKFFVSLWQNYIKPFFKRLVALYDLISAQIKFILTPILNLIQTIRDLFLFYVKPWIDLVQNIISVMRVILSAFRLLGAKWAAKLDADLQRIQGYLTTFVQDIVGTLNAATTWLNLIADPAGILRKGFFTNSMFTNVPGMSRALTFGKDRYLTASEAANTDGDRAMLHGGAAVLTRNTDGSVAYSDASKRINDNFNAAWDSYGPPARPH